MKNNSVRFKIGVLYTSILGVILIFFSIYPIYKTQKVLQKEQEDALLLKARQFVNYVDEYTITSQKDPSAAMLLNQLFRGEVINDRKRIAELWAKDTKTLGLQKDFYRIKNPKGEVLISSKNFTQEAEKNFDIKF